MHMKHQQPNIVDGIESESFFGIGKQCSTDKALHSYNMASKIVASVQHWVVTGHFEEEDGGGHSRTGQQSLKLDQNDQLTLQSYF